MKPCNLQKSLYYLRKSLVKRLMIRLYTLSNHLSMIIISFITVFDSICSPDAEIKEVTCSHYINDIIPDGLASSDSDECMHGIILQIYIICTMQINTIYIFYCITLAESEQTTTDVKSPFLLVPDFSLTGRKRNVLHCLYII